MQTLRQLPRTVWVLGIVSLLTDISSEMIHSVLPLFLVSQLGAAVLTVGLIEGIAEATASVVKVFSGALSDYLGKRKALTVLGYGLSTFVKPLFFFATSPCWVLVARFADRVGKGIRVAPRDALVADTTPVSMRGAAYGLRQSLDTVGAFLGPLTAFGLLSIAPQNFRLVFALALIPGFLAVSLLVVGIKDPEVKTTNPKNNLTNPLRWEALGRLGSKYWLLLAIALIFNLGNSSDAFLLLKAEQSGIAAAFVPLTLVVMNVAYSLSAYPVGVISDRVGRLGLLAGGFLVYALVYLGFAFTQQPWQVWALFILYGLYLGMSQGVLLAMVADTVPVDLRGTAFGFLNLAIGTALLPASLLAGYLWQAFGSRATFLAGSLLATIALVGLGIYRRETLNR